MWNSCGVGGREAMTVWELLREYAAAQSGTFTSQEALSWFRPHAPDKANERTIRTHIRGASWNVDNRSQFSAKEPFLTKLDRGLFRRARLEEIEAWRAELPAALTAPMSAAGRRGRGIRVAQGTSSAFSLNGSLARDGPSCEQRTANSEQRTANTATREHGVDVVAERDGERLVVKVKGYPPRFYIAGPKKGQVKTSTPKEQAKKWYAHALVPAMRLRTHEPDSLSVMCFPDFPVYRQLYADTAASLRAAAVDGWLVSQDGGVEILA
jgi:hypothetical protein